MSRGKVVVRRPARAEAEAVKRLGAAGVATVAEANGRRGILDPGMRPAWAGARTAGTAVTALCHPGDNLMIHVAVEQCAPGDLLVVAVTSPCRDGMFGELLATSLAARGVTGLVIDAGVRDVAELQAMGFGVWSRAISAHGTVKATPGAVNVPVVCGGALIHPGDAVIGDDDGVVVVERGAAEAVAERADQRLQREAATRQRLAAGELGLDIYDLRGYLADQGVTYVDPAAEDAADSDAP